MAGVDTLPELYRPLMDGVTIKMGTCVVCGKNYPLNQHHVVRRGAGKLFKDGKELPKPCVTLCGSGTTGCHGLAHQNRLHFRWVKNTKEGKGIMKGYVFGGGHWEYLITDEPAKYQNALDMDGWKQIRSQYDM